MTRRRKFWGWGFEDQQPPHEQVEAAAAGAREHLGFGPAEVERPARLEDIELPPPRLEAPASLAAICRSDPYERAAHAYGKSYRDVVRAFRGRFDNPPDVVAHPSDEAELERVLAWCEEANAAAIPFGGGTSVVGGVEPPADRPTVSIDLKAMDRVLEVDSTSRAALIQAGATGPRLEEQLREHGLTLRHFPQSFEYSTLGGWIATRAGGHYATLHTHIDDFVESVRALTPRGWWESRQAAGVGRRAEPRPHADRLRGHPRRDHRGVDAGAGRAALQGIGGGPVRLVRIGRAGGARAVAVGPPPVELPAARPRRGGAHRRGARRPGPARARLRVGRPRARPLDGSRARALRRPRRPRRASGAASPRAPGATPSSRRPTCATRSSRRASSPRPSRPRSPGTASRALVDGVRAARRSAARAP